LKRATIFSKARFSTSSNAKAWVTTSRNSLFEDLERLEREAGIHATEFGVHRKLSRRFPFAIYYRVEDSVIDVVAILDCRRDPDTIATRLQRTKR
jgi:plasmid stabilization system protein ParE